MAPVDVVALGCGLARALAHLERHGLSHRAIGASEVWLGPKGDLKLEDFGADRFGGSVATQAWLDRPVDIAPDVCLPPRPGCPQGVFSLALVLYRALTGVPLLENLGALCRFGDREMELDLARAGMLRPALRQMLARDPDGRPHIGDVPVLLERSLHGECTSFPRHRIDRVCRSGWAPDDEPA